MFPGVPNSGSSNVNHVDASTLSRIRHGESARSKIPWEVPRLLLPNSYHVIWEGTHKIAPLSVRMFCDTTNTITSINCFSCGRCRCYTRHPWHMKWTTRNPTEPALTLKNPSAILMQHGMSWKDLMVTGVEMINIFVYSCHISCFNEWGLRLPSIPIISFTIQVH